MESVNLEETLKSLNSCITRTKWRLKSQSRRRLQTDILALCTGLRAVILLDYGGKMPQLQDHLCHLVRLLHQESTILRPLRVMIVEDMVYLVHVKGLAELASSSVRPDCKLFLVDLEQDPLKMLHEEMNTVGSEFLSIQKLFSGLFPVGVDVDLLPVVPPSMTMAKIEPSTSKDVGMFLNSENPTSQSSEHIDLTNILRNTEVITPTLNGWLLGYPVVYLFREEKAADAIYNLSTQSLHIYKILICRNQTSSINPQEEELMSFTVPYELSLDQEKEPWAESFLARLQAKLEGCKQVWASMRLEVMECLPQAIVL